MRLQKCLQELVSERTQERRPEFLVSLNNPLGPKVKASFLTSLAAKLVSKLGSSIISYLNLNLNLNLAPDLAGKSDRWLPAGLLPVWGVDLRPRPLTIEFTVR